MNFLYELILNLLYETLVLRELPSGRIRLGPLMRLKAPRIYLPVPVVEGHEVDLQQVVELVASLSPLHTDERYDGLGIVVVHNVNPLYFAQHLGDPLIPPYPVSIHDFVSAKKYLEEIALGSNHDGVHIVYAKTGSVLVSHVKMVDPPIDNSVRTTHNGATRGHSAAKFSRLDYVVGVVTGSKDGMTQLYVGGKPQFDEERMRELYNRYNGVR